MNNTIDSRLLAAAFSFLLVVQGPVCAKDAQQGVKLYKTFCASCHGEDAKGKGPVASQLTVAPADLTQLAKKNGGAFPQDAVAEKIDGRQEVAAHGSRDMPVWGRRFAPLKGRGFISGDSFPWEDGPTSERDVSSDKLSLVRYLRTLQEK
ncbi:MAG: c-type cytochrome [Methylocystis sp.]|uniref:c-type cytochrome n=1 Tax=Methylocystis sp. TaxID=1911079 RepID=UPI003DA38D9B